MSRTRVRSSAPLLTTRPTLKDVAQAAGFSVATVAFILRGHPKPFPDATREHVLATAERLGYRPNASARATRSGRMGAFALVQIAEPQQGDLSWRTLDGVLGAAESGRDHVLLTRLSAADFADAERLPKILDELVVDGLLISYHTAAPPSLAGAIRALRVPAVWLNTRTGDDCVHLDDHGAAAGVVERLVAAGHRRIAYVNWWHGTAGARHYSMDDRLAGYRSAMAAARLKPQIELGGGDGDARAADLITGRDAPTAVVLYDAGMAANFVIAAARLGIAVPGALSLATFTDHRAWIGDLALAGMVGGYERMGRAAVEMLRSAIASGGRSQPTASIPAAWVDGASIARAPH